MKIKTAELIGPALDWAVAKCEGCTWAERTNNPMMFKWHHGKIPHYSTDWSQGGPIIELECVCIYASGACSEPPKNPDYWVAEILASNEIVTQYGPTPLIAAMRCYVASKLGNVVEIPEELSCEQ